MPVPDAGHILRHGQQAVVLTQFARRLGFDQVGLLAAIDIAHRGDDLDRQPTARVAHQMVDRLDPQIAAVGAALAIACALLPGAVDERAQGPVDCRPIVAMDRSADRLADQLIGLAAKQFPRRR